ncbi:hypothetical protein Adt_39983 [Abeliophyllum distichum]|uniref:Uncharacterized protein n=1 Tax=Abeliophyllum distichum TaxID=126358 RepID=A0ABD1Q7P1_9LAMI
MERAFVLRRGFFAKSLPISDEACYRSFPNWCHALIKRQGPCVGMKLLQKLSPSCGISFLVLGRGLFAGGSFNIRRCLILGFAQLVPCLNEEVNPLYGQGTFTQTKSQLREELSVVEKGLFCRGHSNKSRVLLHRGIREDFTPNLIRY